MLSIDSSIFLEEINDDRVNLMRGKWIFTLKLCLLTLVLDVVFKSVADAESFPHSVPNVLVCFEHANGEISKSATALKTANLGLKLDSSYFKDLWFLDSDSGISSRPKTHAVGPVKMTSGDPTLETATAPGSSFAISKISKIELLALTWARNIQSGGPNFKLQEVNANLILPQEGETPEDFAIRIIKRLKYYSGDAKSGLYADVVKIAFGMKTADQEKAIGAKLNFDKSGMTSVIAPLGNIMNGEKLAADLPDRNNCLITSYSQQIEPVSESSKLEEMPRAQIKFDARLIGSGSASIHKYESRGIAYLDQIMYYASRHLFNKDDSDYTFILADLLRRDLSLQKLENDLAEFGFSKYSRKDPLVLEFNKFIEASQSAEILGAKVPYENSVERKKLWLDLFKNQFAARLAAPIFSYLPNKTKQEVIRLMSDNIEFYWQKYVIDAKIQGGSAEFYLDVFFNKRVLPNFPVDLIIPVTPFIPASTK